jgi:hypothetical protein
VEAERDYLTGGKGFFDGYIVIGLRIMGEGIKDVDNVKIMAF